MIPSIVWAVRLAATSSPKRLGSRLFLDSVSRALVRRKDGGPMKAVLIALSLCSSFLFASDQTIVECKLTKLHDSTYFEEGLSLDEYPEVEIYKNTRTGLNVKIGASKYTDEEDGWT